MEYIIEVAQKEDLHAILKLQKESYLSEAILHNEFNIPPLTQTYESIIDEFDKGFLFLKIVINNKIIASGRGYTSKEGISYISKLAVDAIFQNQKLGQSLLNELENRLSTCLKYELFTGNKSERNLYLYKKFGYQEFKRQLVNDNLSLVYLEKSNNRTK
ncbi:MAG: hypothetical protein RLZZ175_3070 [Bacteroidota bacterium]|jgi:ribosomal protein S18 acetylase RimI-like enzyme